MAIAHADRICHWQENLTGDEMPPEWMWPFPEETEAWLDRVDSERKRKYGGDGKDDMPDDDDMVINDLAKGRGRSRR